MQDENNNIEVRKDEKEKLANTDFMREKIKSRPINSKKLLRRTILTIVLAAIFGIVACCTFILLEPVINDYLNPDSSSGTSISFSTEDASDEILRQDLIANEEEKAQEEAASAVASENASTEREIAQALDSYSFGASDYESMQNSIKEIAQTAEKFMVTVTGSTPDTDWINDNYVINDADSGVIVSSSSSKLFILTSSSNIEDADSIYVTFVDDSTVTASIEAGDSTTGLCVVSVDITSISEDTMDSISIATLGNSNDDIIGTGVIAIGAPIGIEDSICFGLVTSGSITLDLPDSEYKLVTSDIYSNKNASGVVLDLDGSVIGIIDMNHNPEGQENALCMIGISELKTLIQTLANGESLTYLGVHGTDVPDANTDIPSGAYITQIEMDSPAMDAGIQSGDIITKVGNSKISSYGQLISAIREKESGESVKITLMRQTKGSYTELNVTATLANAS